MEDPLKTVILYRNRRKNKSTIHRTIVNKDNCFFLQTERAKIRVEHIIREDYLVEAMEVTEMYCDLLLARYGLIQQMK